MQFYCKLNLGPKCRIIQWFCWNWSYTTTCCGLHAASARSRWSAPLWQNPQICKVQKRVLGIKWKSGRQKHLAHIGGKNDIGTCPSYIFPRPCPEPQVLPRQPTGWDGLVGSRCTPSASWRTILKSTRNTKKRAGIYSHHASPHNLSVLSSSVSNLNLEFGYNLIKST